MGTRYAPCPVPGFSNDRSEGCETKAGGLSHANFAKATFSVRLVREIKCDSWPARLLLDESGVGSEARLVPSRVARSTIVVLVLVSCPATRLGVVDGAREKA